MTTPSPEQAGITGHELLLRLAGRIPDQALAQARRMLADGAVASAIALVATQLGDDPAELTAAEIAAIRTLARDPGALPSAEPAAEPPDLPFGFSELDEMGEVDRDELDEALVAAAQTYSQGVTGIWRTWRYLRPDFAEDHGSAEDEAFRPHRVYLVQVEDPAMIQGLAADLLSVVPDSAAGIEIIALDEEPPAYQSAALAESLLVWATVTAPEFEVARVFDFADPASGPGFAPDHPVIASAPQRDQLLTYLRAGHPVLTTTAVMTDVIDPEAGAVVPTSFRTDGHWIWTETAEYYLDRYGLAPDAQLTEHVQAQCGRGRLLPDTDQDTAVRAAEFLLHPPPEQARTAVWFPGNAGRA